MTFVPFQHADSIGDRFLSLLRKHDIDPLVGSSFEDELLSLTQLIEITKNPNFAVGERQDEVMQTAAGVYDFAAKVLSAEPLSEFESFLPHLRLIAQKKIATASLSQNVTSAYDDDTARKMSELYMGCLAAHVGTEVDLDSPSAAKGDNPDVIFKTRPFLDEVEQPTKSWALAIKTISSNKGQTIFERIKEGAKQIQSPLCKTNHGMVLINAKNAIDHQALSTSTFSTLTEAMDALGAQLTKLSESANLDRPQIEWENIFTDKVKRPVLFLGQTLVYLPTPFNSRTPTPLKMLMAYDANGTLDPQAKELACLLNHKMQTILHGIPGGHGVPPS
jgi:hypothetical protein